MDHVLGLLPADVFEATLSNHGDESAAQRFLT